jgi:hypothetical protein
LSINLRKEFSPFAISPVPKMKPDARQPSTLPSSRLIETFEAIVSR